MANERSNLQKSGQNPQGGQQSGTDVTVRSEVGMGSEAGRSGSVVLGEPASGRDAALPSTTNRGTSDSGLPQKPDPANSPLAQMHALIQRAGEEPYAPDTVRVLRKPINDAVVDIRPDGFIFVSHPHYRDLLDEAFGVGGWALVPLAAPRVEHNKVLWYGFLKAHGRFVDAAIGEMAYFPGKYRSSYGNSAEGAKSDCLVRCCKSLPMFRECWDKEYADYWKSNYAVDYPDPDNPGEVLWKKRDEAKRNFDIKPGRAHQSEWRKPVRVEDENQAHIDAIAGEGRLRLTSKDEYNDTEDFVNDGREF